MSKTGAGLAKWATDAYKSGKFVYWYGTYCNPCTAERLAGKTKQYPGHYAASRQATYKKHIEQGKICTDCVGLIKGYYWERDGEIKYKRDGLPDESASSLYNSAKVKGKLETLPEIPGALLWTSNRGHVGVYVGNGWVIEARGFAYGVQKNRVTARSFTHWGLCPYVAYTPKEFETAQKLAGASTANNQEASKPATGTPLLRKGSKGEAVKELQELLMKAGCKLDRYGADGKFGAETLEALKAYQTAHGLTPDGVCGPKTWESIKGEVNAQEGKETPNKATQRQTIRKGDKGEAVKELQKLLMKGGCKLDRYGADGKFGAETLEALKAYQTAHSLTPDGICGPLTWAALLGG